MWTIYPDNSTTAITTIGANIGLLSGQEFKKIWNLTFVGTMPQWLLNPSTATVGSNIMTIATDSTTGNQSYSSAAQVRPTLYIKSGSVISSGNGSVGSPYIIGGVIAVSSPLALYQASGTDDTISMSWSSVAGASGYKAYREDTLVYSGTDTNLVDTGLPASTAYTYSVKAFTGSIESNPTYGVGTSAAVGQTVPGSGTGGNGSGGGTGGTPLSENNYLSNIVVSGVTLDKSFNKNILNYSSANDVSLNSIKIKATAEDSGSTIKLNGNIIASGVDSQSITLTGGANTFVITVNAASGATKNYSLTINKVLNTINDLSSIIVEGTSLNESFDKNILSYTADVPTGTTNTRITVGSYSIYSTIEINGIPVSQNIASSYLPLSIGDNTFNIEVTAQNGISKTYVVKVKRAGLSSNNNILSVFMGSAQLTPSFSPSVTEYATSVPQTESTIALLAFVENDNATLKINNVPATSGVSFGPLPLQSGLNTFVISVKAQDGTTKNYTVRVTRGEVVSPLPDVSNPPAINFIATDITKTSVKLKWNPIANTDYYLVSRNGSAPSTVTGVTYFEDVNLSEDTDFTYTLIAKNQFGNSIPLTTVAHTLGSPPAKPTNFMATAVYFDSVAIQWDMVNKALTYAVTRNNMQKAYDGKLTVFRDQTVTASTYYDYSVQAKDAYGVSDAVYMRVWTPAAPVLAVSEPVIAKGKVFFEFEIIENASEYHINRNPHWGYIKNAAGTYDVSYDNAVTGETKSMGTVALNGNKLLFSEEGLDAGDYAYKIKALVTNPDGSTSTTPDIDVNTTVTEGATTPPGAGTPETGTPDTGTGNGNSGSGGSSGGSYGGGSGGGSAPISVIEDVPVYDPNASPAGIKGYGSSVGLIPFTDVIPTSGKFSDIADHWCRECIEKLLTLNVVNGQTETLFYPESQVTRAEFTAMVIRALDLQGDSADEVFNDVSKDNWFNSVVNIAAKYGIVEGVADKKFDPEALVTRQEMATILARVLVKYKPTSSIADDKAVYILSKFIDVPDISNWAYTQSAIMVAAHLISGRTDTHFVPRDGGTRAESAKLICGVLSEITQSL
ncbi:cadherin-like beta sandwich domain-containing protein [Paenibacillus periandrae]|uniref:cadherin-like beta sandwich domain-containing protein n=1 Tax=Paenibacillus periandrae TaxID=1761741 RepID=UPI001F09A8B8|nr:cadherin-like beta sandwich domain-containing protein [Paenibacillus periandrae]